MTADIKGNYGTTHSSGKMQTVLKPANNAVFYKNYAEAKVLNIHHNVNNILGTHQVMVRLTKPLIPGTDEVVLEKHLTTDRYLTAFQDLRIQE